MKLRYVEHFFCREMIIKVSKYNKYMLTNQPLCHVSFKICSLVHCPTFIRQSIIHTDSSSYEQNKFQVQL